MADTPTSSGASSRKRSIDEMEAGNGAAMQPNLHHEHDIFSPSTTAPPSTADHDTPLMSSIKKERQSSLAPSTLTSISVNTVSAPTAARSPGQLAPSKRRRLTPQEKAEREEQKRVEAQAREEKRQKRDQDRAAKAEETRKKNEKREETRRQKDLEKKQKELVQKQKDEDALKKERSQSRLTAFFKTGAASPSSPKCSPTRASPPNEIRDRSMSIGQSDAVLRSPSKITVHPAGVETEPQPTEYDKYFLPYSLPANTTLPPENVDVEGKIPLPDPDVSMEDCFKPYKVKRGLRVKPLGTLIASLNGTCHDPTAVKDGK